VTKLTIRKYNKKRNKILEKPKKEAYLYWLKIKDKSEYPQNKRTGYFKGNLTGIPGCKTTLKTKMRKSPKIKV
jgi:hypothetical protein